MERLKDDKIYTEQKINEQIEAKENDAKILYVLKKTIKSAKSELDDNL